MDKFVNLKSKLDISFKDEKIIRQAFNHRSFLNESKKVIHSNERIEFLGDSILSYIVSDYLFEKFPDLPEGNLTNLRSSIVKTSSLSIVSENLGLGELLSLSKGEEEGGGRKNPSILADTFEALIGAIYIDQGLEAAKKIILENLVKVLLPQILDNKLYKDFKSTFQEKVQEKTKTSPVYKVIKEEGPDHAKTFTVGVFVENKLRGEGTGKNKQEAEQQAANNALENWNK